MARLFELASLLRSKNAGPLFITFDIMFEDRQRFDMVVASQVITPSLISSLYDVPADDVRIIPYDIVNSLKITIPRRCISGSVGDQDIYGCQQHMPLADVVIQDVTR